MVGTGSGSVFFGRGFSFSSRRGLSGASLTPVASVGLSVSPRGVGSGFAGAGCGATTSEGGAINDTWTTSGPGTMREARTPIANSSTISPT